MREPEVLARREVARCRFFTYAVETLAAPTGPYDYHQLETRFDAVIVVPRLPGGRLVLERIYRHPYRAWFLEFPAGGIEPGEDPLAAGARELEEETGWRAGRVATLGSCEAMPGLLRMRLHVVVADDLVQTGMRRHEAMELIEVVELGEDEAWAAARAGTPSSFLSLGLLHLAAAR